MNRRDFTAVPENDNRVHDARTIDRISPMTSDDPGSDTEVRSLDHWVAWLQSRLLGAIVLGSLFAAIYPFLLWLRIDGAWSAAHTWMVAVSLPIVVATKLGFFHYFGLTRLWNRYLTFRDLVDLCRANVASSLLIGLAAYVLAPIIAIPRSVFLMDWCVTFVLVGAIRAWPRLHDELQNLADSGRAKRALIVGASDAGEALLRNVQRLAKGAVRVVGFISASEREAGVSIGGLHVLGALEEIEQVVGSERIDEVLITAGSLPGTDVRRLTEQGAAAGFEVKVCPSLDQLLTGKVSLQPRAVSIEDLLRRDPVSLDQGQLRQWLTGRTLLVTGSAGSIGSEIVRQLIAFEPAKLVLVDWNETGQFFLERELQSCPCELIVCMADVGRVDRMRQIFEEHQPDVVFHAAAYKHVPMMERDPGEAVKNIVLTTCGLVDLAAESGVSSFVMISTDKAVNPTSVMGACKRIAERYVQAQESRLLGDGCRFITVRFGNVLDSAGSVVPIFRKQIASGGPVTVTHAEMRRFFMTIPEASQLVIQAGAMGRGGEIFVLDMGEPVRIIDLATDMVRLSGLEVGRDIEIAVVGRRPGEKLYEELHIDGEEHLPTSHPKIMVAASCADPLDRVSREITDLGGLVQANPWEIREAIAEIVPDYSCPDELAPLRRAA